MKITKAVDIDNKKIVYDGNMITVSGTVIDLLNPDPGLISIEDIAHGLAYNCRWNGHTQKYWSVAQHCCGMYDFVSNDMKLTALLHDAEEAYWGDMIKPLKNVFKEVCPEVLIKMSSLRDMIFGIFHVKPINEEIEEADFMLLQWEFNHIIKESDAEFWNPERAKAEWLSRYYTQLSHDIH